jgi:Spy/CpxP family protein refolding chaperone
MYLTNSRGKEMKIAAAVLILAGIISPRVLLFSQTATPTTPQQNLELLRKDLRSQKKQLIAANMTLTSAEAQQFWPVYDQYTVELSRVNDTKLALVKEYAQDYGTLTDAQAQSLVERWAAADQAAVQLRTKYVGMVSKVLPGKKTASFFQLDRRIGVLMDLQAASEIPLVEP